MPYSISIEIIFNRQYNTSTKRSQNLLRLILSLTEVQKILYQLCTPLEIHCLTSVLNIKSSE